MGEVKFRYFIRPTADDEWVTVVDKGDLVTFTTTAFSLRELRDQNPELLVNSWGLKQPFAKRRGQAERNIQFLTSAVPGSFEKTWDEQLELLSEGEFVPDTRTLVDGMIAHYLKTGERLFSNCWVRTRDVSTCGRQVVVKFDSTGIKVDYFWGATMSPSIGLSVARNI